MQSRPHHHHHHHYPHHHFLTPTFTSITILPTHRDLYSSLPFQSPSLPPYQLASTTTASHHTLQHAHRERKCDCKSHAVVSGKRKKKLSPRRSIPPPRVHGRSECVCCARRLDKGMLPPAHFIVAFLIVGNYVADLSIMTR